MVMPICPRCGDALGSDPECPEHSPLHSIVSPAPRRPKPITKMGRMELLRYIEELEARQCCVPPPVATVAEPVQGDGGVFHTLDCPLLNARRQYEEKAHYRGLLLKHEPGPPLNDAWRKRCQYCGTFRDSTRPRLLTLKNYVGPCGDSFCFASCDSSACRPVMALVCDTCEAKISKPSPRS
jgi:hypothetical protein